MTDHELLEGLSLALSAKPPQPSPAAVLALRRAVVEGAPARSSPPWWRRRLVAVTVMVPVVLGGSGAAYALTGAALPKPVRIAASAVGLPVDSVALTDARAASAQLRDGLHHHDHAAVDEAARQLRDRLSHLDAGERQDVEPEADALLGEASQFDAQNTPDGHAGPGDQGSPPATGGGGQDSTGDQSNPPAAGSGGQDGGGQGSVASTGTDLQGGNVQDKSSMTATSVPGGGGGQNSHTSAAAEE